MKENFRYFLTAGHQLANRRYRQQNRHEAMNEQSFDGGME